MGLAPKIPQKALDIRTCRKCGQIFDSSGFLPVNNFFYPDGYLPYCNFCIDKWLAQRNFSWEAVDKICQYIDVPFIPEQWEKIHGMNGNTGGIAAYVQLFKTKEYEGLGWKDYYQQFKELKEKGDIERNIPGLNEELRQQQRQRWGMNYDDEALDYLDSLFNGLMSTQNVNGALQIDQALKICKMSYEIDCRIREGSEFDKLLSSYDKMVKAAEFTPKNVKNLNDFDTCGELIKWMEKKGWRNKFFDNVSRDIVDETIKNFESFNQRLYTNESGIGDDITNRIQNLKSAKEMENVYDTNQNYDIENYDLDGYNELMKDSEEFEVEIGDDVNYG